MFALLIITDYTGEQTYARYFEASCNIPCNSIERNDETVIAAKIQNVRYWGGFNRKIKWT